MKFVILMLVIVIVLLIHEVNKEVEKIKLKEIESLNCEIKDLKEENRILKHDLDIMFSMSTDCRYEEEEE